MLAYDNAGNERKSNVKKVYEVKQNQKIKDKKILLIDDIFTTGNTVNECAKKLKEAGVKEGDTVNICGWELEWYDYFFIFIIPL